MTAEDTTAARVRELEAEVEMMGQVVDATPQKPTAEAGDPRPCKGRNVNVCVAEGCYGEACVRVSRQSEPVERITDANGDELEHGADTDAQTAQQQDRSDR